MPSAKRCRQRQTIEQRNGAYCTGNRLNRRNEQPHGVEYFVLRAGSALLFPDEIDQKDENVETNHRKDKAQNRAQQRLYDTAQKPEDQQLRC